MNRTDPSLVQRDTEPLRLHLKLLAHEMGMGHAISVAASLLGEMLISIQATHGSNGKKISDTVLDALCETVRQQQAGVHDVVIKLDESSH